MSVKIRNILNMHKILWTQKSFITSVFFGMVLLVISMLINYGANVYTIAHPGNYVSDIILDNIPVVNVDFVFFEGFAMFWLFVIFLLVKEPNKVPFVIKSIVVFIAIRSVFITLTHLGQPPVHSYIEPDSMFRFITSGNDMFFSSHTGLPFLMALNFWNNKMLRNIFIGASVFFATVVLLGHLHYSIDVFAAYFITYSIYNISKKAFPADYKLFITKKSDEWFEVFDEIKNFTFQS